MFHLVKIRGGLYCIGNDIQFCDVAKLVLLILLFSHRQNTTIIHYICRSTAYYYMFRLNQAIIRDYDANLLNCYAYINNMITIVVALIKYKMYTV
jgi:hypothetical protein